MVSRGGFRSLSGLGSNLGSESARRELELLRGWPRHTQDGRSSHLEKMGCRDEPPDERRFSGEHEALWTSPNRRKDAKISQDGSMQIGEEDL
ncbi:MAG: hypothetical protein HC857_01655 [Synechococcales cyanobacterium RU_4_20]|nr:hypothetical protein [Synechococcales cyanobacterium RU_4_20]